MKIGIYSDAHFSKSSSIWSKTEGFKYSDRLDTLVNTYKWMYKLFEKEGVELILNLGDTFSSDSVDAVTQTALFEALTYSRKVKEYWLLGNHEIYTKDSSKHSLVLLNYHPNIELVQYEGKVIQLPGDFYIIMQPYMPNNDISYITSTLEFYKDYRNIVCTHQMYSNIIPAVDGADWNDILRISSKTKRIFNGHIHDVNENGKYCQVGSLVSSNFSDNYTKGKPGVIIYSTESDIITRYETPSNKLFLTLEYNSSQDLDNIIDLYDNYLFLRVKAGLSKKDEILRELKQCNTVKDYRLQLYNDDVTYSREEDNTPKIRDIYEILRKYLEQDKDNLPASLPEFLEFVNQIRLESEGA